MVLVDSGVWIDYFRGVARPHTDALDALLGTEPVLIGDLMLAEVLQGFTRDREFATARRMLAAFTCIEIVGERVAVEAARNFRRLRALGITPRKTIDTVIATRCILDGLTLLHCDQDFVPFERHLGLRTLSLRG